MIVHRYQSWRAFFNRFLCEYHGLAEPRRRQLVFRGQADSRWGLQASLDRLRSFATAALRGQCLERLVVEFRRQAQIIHPGLDLASTVEWELLGRHHGLPTSVLDFSASPYIAAWFALTNPPPNDKAKYASIWMLDRDVFAAAPAPQVVVLDADEAIRFNPRALDQQGLFLKILDVSAGSPERILTEALTRHDIPFSERRMALGMLEDMTITARTMYSDLGAAAQAAAARVMVIAGDN